MMTRFVGLCLIIAAPAFAPAGQHPPDFRANPVRVLPGPDHLILLVAATVVAGLAVGLRQAGTL